MNRAIKIACLLTATFFLNGCYTRRAINYIQDRKDLPQYEQGEYEEYHLRPNDEIVMRVLSNQPDVVSLFPNIDLNYSNTLAYRIYADGTVDLPYLSHVMIAGKTLREAEQEVEKRLKSFSNDIRVKLALNTGTYCVIGEAGRGYFPIYKDRLTIFQALALSGNIHKTADFSTVKIIRETPKGTEIKSFDIRSKSILDSEYYYIYPNDIIYLEISRKRFWALDSYATFVSIMTSSLNLMLSVINFYLTK